MHARIGSRDGRVDDSVIGGSGSDGLRETSVVPALHHLEDRFSVPGYCVQETVVLHGGAIARRSRLAVSAVSSHVLSWISMRVMT